MPKSIKPSDKVLEILTIECEARDIAMAMIGSDEIGVCMILFGNRNLSPDQASIIAANLLLNGVITNAFHQENEEKLETEHSPIPKESLN